MKTIYETKQITLAPFCRELIKETDSRYEKWFYDQEVTKYNNHGLFPYGKERMEQYLDMCESGTQDIVWAIILKENNSHIGNISLQRINWVHRSAEFAIIIGETEYHGRGIAAEALIRLFDHAFYKLNLHRIWTGTAASNKGMIAVAMKLGMKNEGMHVDGMFLNGRYEDVHCFYITEDLWQDRRISL